MVPTVPVRHALTVLAVRDPARSAAFYQAAFGWTLAVEVPVYRELVLPGGMRLGLYEQGGFGVTTTAAPTMPEDGAIGPAELYLYPDDPEALEALVATVEACGARLLSPLAPRTWGDEVAYLADPDGHVLALARAPTTEGA